MTGQHLSGMGRPFYRRSTSSLIYVVIAILLVGVMLTALNVYELHRMKAEHNIYHQDLARSPETEGHQGDETLPPIQQPIVWIEGSPSSKNNGPKGYLRHIYAVFKKLGFAVGEQHSDWLVMWSHDYPFQMNKEAISLLKSYQKVNHFPGSGWVTNKVSLAQTDLKFIPKAFEIPTKKAEFLMYSAKHKNASWVQKSNMHRGIKIKKVEELDLGQNGSFVQEYVANPFLIDGHKFDIGVYTILTSIDPLRVYIINSEALFRFCPQKYYPFDPTVLDKYVVGDHYLPMWKLPSLEDFYTVQGYTFKNSFNALMRHREKDPDQIWDSIKSAIRDVYLNKEKDLIKASRTFKFKRNFFEMVRFDFVLDEDLNVFLMEANMSPNLSSGHFGPNARLYEHVLFNLLGLVGLTQFIASGDKRKLDYSEEMKVSTQDIRVFPDFCQSRVCTKDCKKLKCKLCKRCLSSDLEIDLKTAYLEHNRKGTSLRIFPPTISQEEALAWDEGSKLLSELNEKNQLMYLWYIGKCRLDSTWCV